MLRIVSRLLLIISFLFSFSNLVFAKNEKTKAESAQNKSTAAAPAAIAPAAPNNKTTIEVPITISSQPATANQPNQPITQSQSTAAPAQTIPNIPTSPNVSTQPTAHTAQTNQATTAPAITTSVHSPAPASTSSAPASATVSPATAPPTATSTATATPSTQATQTQPPMEAMPAIQQNASQTKPNAPTIGTVTPSSNLGPQALSQTSIIPAPPAIAAKSYILIDQLSDHIITEQDIDQRKEPASLTKMMTIYVVDQAIKAGKVKPTDSVPISAKAWRAPGSRMFLEVNSNVPLEELMKGIIIQSGNDASIAVAEYIAGSEESFADLMNYYAKNLGMVNTHFVNTTGLPDPNHYTSARDMAILAKAIVRDFPKTYALYSEKEFTYKNIKQPNRNRLLWRNELVDGIKTGHTDTAGYCLVASGQREGMRLIAVVMGAKTDNLRVDETNKLINYGFRFYETRKLYPATTPVKQTRIWMGKEKEVIIGLANDLYVTIGRGQYDRLKAVINVDKTIKAPIAQGAILGTISVQLGDKVVAERPIIALKAVPEGGIFNRIYDSIGMTFQSLIDKVIS